GWALVEKGLGLGIRVGVADGCDLLAGDAAGHKLRGYLVVGRVPPQGRVDPRVGEDKLRASKDAGRSPDRFDVGDGCVDLEAREIGSVPRKKPPFEGELSTVGRDGKGVIDPGVYLLRSEPLVPSDKLLLKRVLLV